MVDNKLTITVENCNLPELEDEKDQLITDIQSELASVLVEYQTFPEQITVYDGDIYSCVSDRCPDCGKQLRLRRVEPDAENGATASAHCACGWTGHVVYRIIDIIENIHEDPIENFLNPDSVLTLYGVTPLYVPHVNARPYPFKPSEDD